MEAKSPALERPRAVQMAAAVLMMTPVLDILMMQRTGTQVFSWISWLMIFGAGVSLLIRHKLSWVIGIGLCSVVVISTAYRLVTTMGDIDPAVSAAMMLDCMLVLFIVGTVSYFFRYPYLDRRQNWFAPTGDRFSISTPVVLRGVETQTIDLSYTGARIALPASTEPFKTGETVTLQLSEINDIQCRAKVVEVRDNLVRVRFEGTSSSEKDLIRQWLNSQNLQKV
ncbi:PilZ domain-containing protein [Bdellovibrio sp. 22V]|uniref:PilZ domain-containing protein n=1 Tax=Bdellovibrio TaxID=958 RepID=UPI0025438630|nr:PilZ domain-containing protein [Bdellovibrio sp. 22V]WII73704.1 PilZ domain-containing protein [Bdellovibrio sp. 22V]